MNLILDFQQRVLPVKNKLYRFALRLLGNGQEAEDVVQEVMVKVWIKRQEMHTYLNMEAWCMRLTKNLSLDRLRARKRAFDSLPEKLEMAASMPTPDVQAEHNDLLALVHETIEQLPEKQKMVIQLRDIEGYTYKEIAEIMEVSMEQVKVNLFRARQRVKKRLKQATAYRGV